MTMPDDAQRLRDVARVVESIADAPGRVDVTVHPRTGRVDVHTHDDENGDSAPMSMIPAAWLRKALSNATHDQGDYVQGSWGQWNEGWNDAVRALGQWLDRQVNP